MPSSHTTPSYLRRSSPTPVSRRLDKAGTGSFWHADPCSVRVGLRSWEPSTLTIQEEIPCAASPPPVHISVRVRPPPVPPLTPLQNTPEHILMRTLSLLSLLALATAFSPAQLGQLAPTTGTTTRLQLSSFETKAARRAKHRVADRLNIPVSTRTRPKHDQNTTRTRPEHDQKHSLLSSHSIMSFYHVARLTCLLLTHCF